MVEPCTHDIARWTIGDRPLFLDPDGRAICVLCWEALFKANDSRRIGSTRLGPFSVSTVWVGIDHAFGGTPLIFETMVFGGALDQQDCWRYATRAEAVEGHAYVVNLCRLELAATGVDHGE